MLTCDYIVEMIDGDYAHLRRVDEENGELKLVTASGRDHGRQQIAL